VKFHIRYGDARHLGPATESLLSEPRRVL